MKRAIRSCKFRRDLPELGESGVYIEDPTMKKRKKIPTISPICTITYRLCIIDHYH
jgi:hypothetical protein